LYDVDSALAFIQQDNIYYSLVILEEGCALELFPDRLLFCRACGKTLHPDVLETASLRSVTNLGVQPYDGYSLSDPVHTNRNNYGPPWTTTLSTVARPSGYTTPRSV